VTTTSAPAQTDTEQAANDLLVSATGVKRSPRTRRAARRHHRWVRPYRLALIVIDFAVASAAGLIAVATSPRANSGDPIAQSGLGSPQVLVLTAALLVPAAWAVMLWAHGAYEARYLGLGSDEFKRVVKAAITLTATICFLAFTLKAPLSRKAVATVLPLILLYTVAGRYAARKALHMIRKRGRAQHRLLLVGTLGEALSVYRITTRNPHAGLRPVGIALSEGRLERGSRTPLPVSEGIKDVLERADEYGADTIAVCGHRGMSSENLRRLAWQLEGTGVDLVVAPSLTNIAGPRVHVRPVEGLPLLHVEEPTMSGLAWLLKGVIDRASAAFGLVVLSPILGAVAAMIKMGSPGPVFFRQARAGRGGEAIHVWKFRTMYVDAEERLAQLMEQNETDGLLFKMKEDPRITRVGGWLRRLSLDELPQLINVLAGEMSLVGPRPLPTRDEDYVGDSRRRLLVRPGITGLWQVSGRSNLSWEDAVRLDLYYVDNWSLVFDAMIMWKTLFAVLKREGAY
jgi:exopolysaccharide biosynthesis polyprenyl glycosylphosphotransferase